MFLAMIYNFLLLVDGFCSGSVMVWAPVRAVTA